METIVKYQPPRAPSPPPVRRQLPPGDQPKLQTISLLEQALKRRGLTFDSGGY